MLVSKTTLPNQNSWFSHDVIKLKKLKYTSHKAVSNMVCGYTESFRFSRCFTLIYEGFKCVAQFIMLFKNSH